MSLVALVNRLKLRKIVNKSIKLSTLTMLPVLLTSPNALADFLANTGGGGYYDKVYGRSYSYEYELWLNDTADVYTLKVWNTQNYPHGASYSPEEFKSAREALDHFDCKYSRVYRLCNDDQGD